MCNGCGKDVCGCRTGNGCNCPANKNKKDEQEGKKEDKKEG